MTGPDIPAEAVEAAARRLYRYDREQAKNRDEWPEYEELPSGARSLYRSGGRDVLAAALPHLHAQWLAEVKPAIERLTPCRCDPAYTERGLHQSDCLLEIREDVLDALAADAGGEGE